MQARRLLVVVLASLALAAGWPQGGGAASVEKADVKPATATRPITLRDRLVVGLEARLKSEVAFCEAVVLKVRAGQLPQRVVDETFFWARDRAGVQRAGRARRPIIYFQPAMLARAKMLHVAL